MYSYPVKSNAATKLARERVLAYIKVGANEQKRLIDYCAANVPRDRYVPPSRMDFTTEALPPGAPSEDAWPRLIIRYKRSDGKKLDWMTVHKHAIGQLCEVSGMKRQYASFLDEPSVSAWRRDLLAHNFNVLFEKQVFLNRLKKPAEFLHRIVGSELRAVLTQSYNRHLVSTAVLQPFLAVCDEVGLQPAKATITDMRVHLQTYLPYAFEPIPGEFVALGTAWGNSDFGQGKLRISHSILRLNGLGNLVTDDVFSRMHIGSVVEDTDLKLHDDVAVKELEAVAAATQSAVREAMQPAQVQKTLDAITQASLESVPWAKLKDKLSKFLNKGLIGTVESMLEQEVTELPPPGKGANGEPLPSRWWAAAALAHLAEKQTDETAAMELKQAAGVFLGAA